jgi:hypothetical protein
VQRVGAAAVAPVALDLSLGCFKHR